MANNMPHTFNDLASISHSIPFAGFREEGSREVQQRSPINPEPYTQRQAADERQNNIIVHLYDREACGGRFGQAGERFSVDRSILFEFLPRTRYAVRRGTLMLESFFLPVDMDPHPPSMIHRALHFLFHHLQEYSRTGTRDMFGAAVQEIEQDPVRDRAVNRWAATMHALCVVLDNERGLGCARDLLAEILDFFEILIRDVHDLLGWEGTAILFEAFAGIFRTGQGDLVRQVRRIWNRFDPEVQEQLLGDMRRALPVEGIDGMAHRIEDTATSSPPMSESRKSNKSPLQSIDPQPIRSPSPSRDRDRERERERGERDRGMDRGFDHGMDRGDDRGPERSKSYPGPEAQYGVQYGSHDYRTQDFPSQSFNTQNYDSQGFNTQSYNQPYNPQNYPPVSGPQTGPNDLPMRPVSESYLPNHAGAMANSIKPPQQMVPANVPADLRELQALRTNCQFGLREYMSLQRQRRSGDSAVSAYELETRIRHQTTMVLSDLRILQGEVRSIAKEAENHRWRRWIIGGAITAFIPLIRRFWRRNDDDEDSHSSANDTEYAFKKSKGLLDHIKNGVLGKGRFAKLAFIVFAVLFVFSNEVSIRVARTVQKRLKKLTARIEHGDPSIDDNDMKLLEGWRWRVLLW
ncbi:sodium glutamate symporter [Fusarium heterosporum]|uniref:Sodium glutamate symporter n=1 Tax=Fusarium heterosporum TaxID=42747 RepID=A0A8H5WQ82_FUSHE|nr:sodium glutamate symporter [Fusarium heterosporum]